MSVNEFEMNILKYKMVKVYSKNLGIYNLYKSLNFLLQEDLLLSIELAHKVEKDALMWKKKFQYDLGVLFLMQGNYKKGLEWLLIASKNGYLKADLLIEDVYGITASIVKDKAEKILKVSKLIRTNHNFIKKINKLNISLL